MPQWHTQEQLDIAIRKVHNFEGGVVYSAVFKE
jgi:hypothetical protein